MAEQAPLEPCGSTLEIEVAIKKMSVTDNPVGVGRQRKGVLCETGIDYPLLSELGHLMALALQLFKDSGDLLRCQSLYPHAVNGEGEVFFTDWFYVCFHIVIVDVVSVEVQPPSGAGPERCS